MQADTTINSFMFNSINSGDNTYQAGGGGIAIIEDVLTTPKGIALNSVGIEYDNGTSVETTTWDDITTRVSQLSAIAPNNLNASILAINDTISIQNGDTAPTRVINTQAGANTGGEHFGVEWIGNTLPFIMQTLDATPLQVVDTSFVLVDSVAPLSTTMTATDLTSGASTRTWADIIASTGSTNTLQQVLANGNTATGASANIGLTTNSVGGLTAPQLTLNNNNTNATLNVGFPTCELYKSGRNAQTSETLGSISFYGLDAVAQKTEFARIQVKTENVASGNEDGTMSIFNSVNGVNSEVFNFNGGQNENNSFRPLDMNGNNIRTTTGSLTMTSVGSSGTGDLTLSAKNVATLTGLGVAITSTGTAGDAITLASAGNINLIPATGGGTATFIRTDSSIQTLTSAGGNKIDFAGGNADERFNIDKTELLLHWNNAISDQSDISIENDIASLNNVISQFYQSASGNLQTIIQNTPSVFRFQQLDSINGRTSELSPADLELINTTNGTTAFLNNNLGSYQNELILSANNTSTPLSTQAKISNNPTNQYITFVNNSSGTSNTKALTLKNETSTSPSLSWVNNIDNIPFNITSNQDLNIGATNNLDITTAVGDLDISSANDVNILATSAGMGTRNINLTANGAVNLTTSSSLTMTINNNLTFTGAGLQSSSSGGNSGEHLVITLNGNQYKIALQNP